MTSYIEHDDDFVDLGAVSEETHGAVIGSVDSDGGQLTRMGITDD